ncbi:helix-turn-helix domain-containing protein [Changpingibacter yushuensis]|uniref:helix-turn-helix domain-containing protein n=1 Tax=Changpingibacter yushuensis TaxID=2758440 RepID=UPI00165D88CD|nr:helix-turn-helix transcriptional regulator [Changpingibacter yushuensis]
MTTLLGMDTYSPTPGTALRALRNEAGMTLEEVAREAGVSATHLSRVETGAKQATPQWIGAVAEAIAKRLQGIRDLQSEKVPA